MTRTPALTTDELESMGAKIALYPLTLLSVAADALRTHLGSGPPFVLHARPLSFTDLRDIVGFPARALVERYRDQA